MIDYQYDDGGREAAGYRGRTGDCVVRAIAVCARQDYRAVYLTMAEQMKRNGYAASGNAYAIRERSPQERPAARARSAPGASRTGSSRSTASGRSASRRERGPRSRRRTAGTGTASSARRSTWRPSWTGRCATPLTAACTSGPSPGRSPRGTSSARRRRPASRRASARPSPSGSGTKRQEKSEQERSNAMRLAAQAKGGFYPTPPRVVDMIAELVYPSGARYRSQDAVRALDPCCGAGEALAQLAERLRDRWGVPMETYGVELHRERVQEASERLDHVLAADLFQTSVANGAFGLLYLNPPYDYDSDGQEAGGARLPDPLHPLPGGGRAAGVHRPPPAAHGLRQVPGLLLPGPPVLGLPAPGAGGLRPGGRDGLPQGRAEPRPRGRAAGPGVGGGGAGGAGDAPPPAVRRSRLRRGRSCSPPARWTPWRPRPRRGGRGCGRAPGSRTPCGPRRPRRRDR